MAEPLDEGPTVKMSRSNRSRTIPFFGRNTVAPKTPCIMGENNGARIGDDLRILRRSVRGLRNFARNDGLVHLANGLIFLILKPFGGG
jgi:hypothetical protein